MRTFSSRIRALCICLGLALIAGPVAFTCVKMGLFAKRPEMDVQAPKGFDRTLVVVAEQNFAPYSFRLKDGTAAGYEVELLYEIAARLRTNVDLRLMRWDDAMRTLKEGRADLLLGVDILLNSFLEEGLAVTTPLSMDSYHLYGRGRLSSLDEVGRYRLGGYQEDFFFAEQLLPHESLRIYPNYSSLLEAVSRGEVDFVLARRSVATRLLSNDPSRFPGVRRSVDDDLGLSSYLAFGAKPSNANLIAEISDACRVLGASGRVGELRSKWLDSHYARRTLEETLRTYDNVYMTFAFCFLLYLVSVAYIAFVMRITRRNAARERAAMLAMEAERSKRECMTQLAMTDQMTGLANRNALFADETTFLEKVEKDACVVVLDINSLKQVNDTFGHQAGDEIIQGAARCIQAVYAPYGRIYRMGGDEFVCLLDATEELLVQAETALETQTAAWRGEIVDELHISVGWAARRGRPEANLKDLFSEADQRMYENKARYYRLHPEKSGRRRREMNAAQGDNDNTLA